MVYKYYLPVENMGLAFYWIEDSEQRAEIWTPGYGPTADDPSSLNGKSSTGAGSVCYIALLPFFLMEKGTQAWSFFG